MRSSHFDVLVVGAGILGLATARSLAASGRDVTVVAEFPPGASGASVASSRIVRAAHGVDRDLTELADRSFDIWTALQDDYDEKFYVKEGVHYFGYDDRAVKWLEASALELDRVGRKYEIGPSDILPNGLNARADSKVLFEPEGGFLRGAVATRAMAIAASRAGVRFAIGKARMTSAGTVIDSSYITAKDEFWAIGLQTGEVFPEGCQIHARTQQYLIAEIEPHSRLIRSSWIDMTSPEYGVFETNTCVKIAIDDDFPISSPPTHSLSLESHRSMLAARLPGLEVRRSFLESCGYNSTERQGPLVHRFGSNRLALIADNGEGFKIAPAFGSMIAKAMCNEQAMPDRFIIEQKVSQS